MNTEGTAREVCSSGYAIMEHTADVGVHAWGPTPAASFAAAARGMYAIALGRDPAQVSGPQIARSIVVNGTTWDDLLVNWLAELLFSLSVEGLVVQDFDISKCVPPRCVARVIGCTLDDEDQDEGGEIKAVTYHHLAIEVHPDRTTLRVLFDI